MKYEEGEKEMKKRRGNFLAGLLAIVMLMTTVLSGTGGPRPDAYHGLPSPASVFLFPQYPS